MGDEVEGLQGITLQNIELSPETKLYIGLYDVQQKPHRKHLAYCMSPFTGFAINPCSITMYSSKGL